MTMEQARNILGISHSASLKTAEQAYDRKCRQAQIRLVPGNLCSDRRKAQAELVELTTAWKMLSAKGPPQPKSTVGARRTANRAAAYTSKESLAGFWDEFIDILPLPKPLAAIFFVAVFILVVISLLKLL